MTKETIIAQLEALLQNEDFKETQAGVSSIRASYNEIVNEANKDEHDTAIEALLKKKANNPKLSCPKHLNNKTKLPTKHLPHHKQQQKKA